MVLPVKYVHVFCTCPLLNRSQSFEILLNLDLVFSCSNISTQIFLFESSAIFNYDRIILLVIDKVY